MNDTNQINSQPIVKASKIKKVFTLVHERGIHLWQLVKGLSKRNKILLSSGGAVLVLVVVITAISIPSSSTATSANTHQTSLQQHKMAQLNHIESQLSVLTSEINQTGNPSAQQVAAISSRLNQIQGVVKNLATQSGMQEVKTLVTTGNKNLTGKVTNLLTLVKQIKKQLTPVTYLKASVLPFKPVSVDIWNGVSYATVKLDDHAALMAKNETRGGWTVTKLDYDAQEVVFENHKNQFVRIYIEN